MGFWRSQAMELIEDRLQLSFSYWEDQGGWPFKRPRVYKDEKGEWIHDFPADRDYAKDTAEDCHKLYLAFEQVIDASPELINGVFDYRTQKFGPFLPQWHDRVRAAIKEVYAESSGDQAQVIKEALNLLVKKLQISGSPKGFLDDEPLPK